MRVLVFILGLVFAANAGLAAVPNCEAMAQEVGRRAGLPEGYLPAISRIESGRQVDGARRGWPWTLNHAGKGLYFETRAEAMAYLKTATQKGRTNIDVGCMQVNHYWHGAQFTSLEAMMDPATNIKYAAQFLADLYAKHGSWVEAVKHYHSPDDARGRRYYRGFEYAQKQIQDTGPQQTVVAASMESGGFFNLGTIGGNSGPLVTVPTGALFPNIQGGSDIEDVYARLISALGTQSGAQDFAIWAPVDALTEQGATRGVVHENWTRVQRFRQSLVEQ